MTGDLADIDGDLAWHSGTYDHALDCDANGWYCRTCRELAAGATRPLATG